MKVTLTSLLRRLAGASALVALAAVPVQAELLVYEPFNYDAGSDVFGQNGGLGFSEAWRGHDNNDANVPAGSFTVVSGSLAHPTQAGDLPTMGNSALLTGEFGTLQPARSFASSIGTDGGTTWISYIGQRLGPAQDPATTAPNNPYPRGVNVSFFDAEHASRAERTGIGNSSNAADNEWSIIPEGSGGLREGSGSPFTDLQWAVMRIDHVGDSSTGDDYYLWLSPDPTVEPDVGSAAVTILSGDANSVDATGLDFLRPFIGNESSGRPYGVLAMDELRVGTTFADMSAVVPEPTSLALLALGAFGVARRRRS
ncbi:MAG: PEP-CTERM sorting domain-containing protein [Planctomycetales bacterium]|nr:PEP-CTERM sorting domain-containing protein [Planctomycetales bacterium]